MTFLDPASFCTASLRNTSPKCGLNWTYRVFLRHLGMNTTWYLHSHLVWLKLSYSSIDGTSFRVLWRLTIRSFVDGPPRFDPRKCQTFAAPRQSRGNSHWIRMAAMGNRTRLPDMLVKWRT